MASPANTHLIQFSAIVSYKKDWGYPTGDPDAEWLKFRDSLVRHLQTLETKPPTASCGFEDYVDDDINLFRWEMRLPSVLALYDTAFEMEKEPGEGRLIPGRYERTNILPF